MFKWLVPFLHEWEVREFYLNIKIQENGGFITNVRNISFRVDEYSLYEILKVKKAGIRTIVDKSPLKSFLEEAGKLKNLKPSAVSMKLLKGQYQLCFDWPKMEKRTIANMENLYLMEKLSIMVEINLLALMIEYMTKVLNMAE